MHRVFVGALNCNIDGFVQAKSDTNSTTIRASININNIVGIIYNNLEVKNSEKIN